MSDVNSVFADRGGWMSTGLALLGRQVWLVALFVTLGAASMLVFARTQPALTEVSAVVLVQAGTSADGVAALLLGRDNLMAMSQRHGMTGKSPEDTAVVLRKSIAINSLTSEAGQDLGYAAQQVGVVVSVRLSGREVAARIANDLAQQILDFGNTGHFDENQRLLDFYRRDEARLWEEMSALSAEKDQAVASGVAFVDNRQVMLMQDQYDIVHQRLAETEIAVRLMRHQQAGQFSLLSRAAADETEPVARPSLTAGLVGSLLSAAALIYVAQRRLPTQQRGVETAGLRERVYRHFDDPVRPILGIPRFVVISVLIVGLLSVAAKLLA